MHYVSTASLLLVDEKYTALKHSPFFNLFSTSNQIQFLVTTGSVLLVDDE